ncbi:MAG: DNA translocase FtsK [Firmicutes bacterium]|nr:DNA translocase FtsK [Bacillota bacterium]
MAEKKKGPGRPPGSKNKTTNTSSSKKSSKPTSKAKEKAQEIQAKKKADRRVIDEIWAIIAIAIGVFLVVATMTDGAGQFGVIIDEFLKGLFGFVAYILPFYLILLGILLFSKKTVSISFKTTFLAFILLLMIATMNSVHFVDEANISFSLSTIKEYYGLGVDLKSGGFFGMLLATLLIKWFGVAGCWIFAIVTTIICLLLIINTPVSRFIRKIADKIEERKLIKENAHLDIPQDDIVPEGVQVSMKDISKAEVKTREEVRQSLVAPKREIKIVDSNQALVEQAPATPTHVNIEKIEPLTTEKKNSILRYMKDETLFGKTSPSGTFGLEEKNSAPTGFGIDGGVSKPSTSLGLTADVEQVENVESEVSSAPEKNVYETEKKLTNKEAKEAMLTVDEINSTQVKKYKKPPISLLDKPVATGRTNSSLLTEKAEKLEDTLKNFNVDARVVQVTQGPTVTRYEVQPAVGVKVSSIVRLADDIALNLEAKSIRIEAPIPGKAAVGIEVENESVTMVKVREIIDSQEFKDSKSKITVAIGKDINGTPIVADLKAMPHLLIAGSTGSGKSVCINTIITSILYKATPEEVKLILIDPKVVELGNYNGVPHLMIPVVTEPSKAAAALNWAVAEMTDRYKKFAERGVRDLQSYNDSVKAELEDEKVLPQVVIIIDELADLMMAAPSQIEESICRLAQMARAAGMHLIVATQRPSVDVITGVIKANIGSRIAFAVSSQIDSRTILDTQGAEKLVGKGDMLLSVMGKDRIRVQGAFISDAEVNKVIEHVKEQVEKVDYNEDVLTRIERTEVEGSDESDELLPDAIDLVVRSGQASVSMLQRRFRIGYNRAARIMDMMEARGIVSMQDGSRPRQVLMTAEELEQMENDIEGN